MSQKIELTPLNEDLGQESYIRYLGGLAILTKPNSLVASDLIGEAMDDTSDESNLAILVHAESLMWHGLSGVVGAANSTEKPNSSTTKSSNFDRVAPNIMKIVGDAYGKYSSRIDAADMAMPFIRPMPLNYKPIYNNFWRGRKYNQLTSELLDGFMPDSRFRAMLDGRRMDGAYAKPD